MLAMFLGLSIAACMSSALSEPGGAGLGTIGLPPRTAKELTRRAGFTQRLEHEQLSNSRRADLGLLLI
jgi:hypothetical protein